MGVFSKSTLGNSPSALLLGRQWLKYIYSLASIRYSAVNRFRKLFAFHISMLFSILLHGNPSASLIHSLSGPGFIPQA
ncbi:hypothetical protein HMPREF1548_01228 [Clostridium sp. KLE 1755]|nr:hypothetical protein HMPREF1548_01228 [Clostridium sp. KLE 1755]